MIAAFALDPQLAADALPLGELPLSSVLLINDARFPWFVLVPRIPDAREITVLGEADAVAVMTELRIAVRVMLDLPRPDKVNLGALGNAVPQLHVHVVGRSAPL